MNAIRMILAGLLLTMATVFAETSTPPDALVVELSDKRERAFELTVGCASAISQARHNLLRFPMLFVCIRMLYRLFL